MQPTQNRTDYPIESEVIAANKPLLSLYNTQQQLYIDYCAMGGLITDDEGTISRMTAQEFADKINVGRRTLFDWQKKPDFWQLVKQRRQELSKGARATKVYNGLYLKAAKGEPAAVKLWAEIFDNYQPPAQKHDIQITGGVADLLDRARERESKTIEGEVTSERPPTND